MEIQAQNSVSRPGRHAALADRRLAASRDAGAGGGPGRVDCGHVVPVVPSSHRAIIVERAARVQADATIGYAETMRLGATAGRKPVPPAPAQPVPGGLVGSSVRSLDGRPIGTVSETRGFNNQMLQVSVATHGGLAETSRTIFLQMALRDIPGKTIRLNHDLATLSRLYGK